MRVDENVFHVLYGAFTKLDSDYNIKWFDRDLFQGYIDEDDLLTMIEDLVYKIDDLEEKYEDLEQDLHDNYRPIPPAEQYEISDRDFI